MVPNAFSEALGAQNRLLGYGGDIRCAKQPPLVRDAFSGTPGHAAAPSRTFRSTEKLLPLRNFELHRKIGLLHKQKADSITHRRQGAT